LKRFHFSGHCPGDRSLPFPCRREPEDHDRRPDADQPEIMARRREKTRLGFVGQIRLPQRCANGLAAGQLSLSNWF